MKSTGKTTALLISMLAIEFMTISTALAYDQNAFPGIGNKSDFERAKKFSNEGTSFLRQGKLNDSVQRFKLAIGCYPHTAGIHYNLGRAYGERNNLKGAFDSYKNAIRLAPDLAPAYTNISDIQFKLKDYQGAEQSAKKSTQLDSTSPAAFINLAQAEIALKKLKQAKQHLQMAQRLPDGAEYAGDVKLLSDQIQRSMSKTAEN